MNKSIHKKFGTKYEDRSTQLKTQACLYYRKLQGKIDYREQEEG